MGVFQKRLEEMMEKKGMKQADLAKATGISRSLISSYLSGRYRPNDERLKALADALECDPMWLGGFDCVEEDDEEAFLDQFKRLNVEDKRTILTLLNFMLNHDRKDRDEM